MCALPKICGLIGCPLQHTLSPVMHEAAYKHLGLHYRYIAFEVPSTKLADALKGMRALDFVGINVTIPHKEAVMEFIDECVGHARKIGAVNTIHNRNGKFIGYNTDACGFLRSLTTEGAFIPRGKRAVIFGAGGAAKAVASALAGAGARRIVIADINTSWARKLERLLKVQFNCDAAAYPAGEERVLFRAIQESDILVNATPIGLKPHESVPLMLKSLHERLFVYDVIYADTKLIKTARRKGLRVLNGLGMLVYQGAEAFKIWTKRNPPVEIMRKAVEKYI